jgi:hypothetical protein
MKSNKFSPNFSGSNAPEVQDTSLVPFSPPHFYLARIFLFETENSRAYEGATTRRGWKKGGRTGKKN